MMEPPQQNVGKLGGTSNAAAAAASAWTTITYDNFQNGWGNFQSSHGSSTTSIALNEENDFVGWDSEQGALWISNDLGNDSSVFWSSNSNGNNYPNIHQMEDLRVTFSYIGNDMKDGESFFLESRFLNNYQNDHNNDRNNNNWQTIKEYVAGIDFVNYERTMIIVTFSEEGITFPPFIMSPEDNTQTTDDDLRMDDHEFQIRFRCNAPIDSNEFLYLDFIYIDEVHFEGLLQTTTVSSSSSSSSSSSNPTDAVNGIDSITSSSSSEQYLSHDDDPILSMESSSSSSSSSGGGDTTALLLTESSAAPPMQQLPTPTAQSASALSIEEWAKALCPIDRFFPPDKFAIEPYKDDNSNDGVEDDLYEISSIAYSDQTDRHGNRYAYMVSDKEQYSLKVIRLPNNVTNTFGPIVDSTTFHGRGITAATYTLFDEIPTNDDWEDISLGPCSAAANTVVVDNNSDGVMVDKRKKEDEEDVHHQRSSHYFASETCIYIGNIGNNARPPKPRRKQLYIYKFVEPRIGPDGPQDQTVQFATIGFQYGNGFDRDFYDAESLFVDWIGVDGNENENAGDIYIPTKGGCHGGVGKIPVSVHGHLGPGEKLFNYSMKRVVHEPPVQGSVNMTCRDPDFREWTGADLRRDGQLLLMIRVGPPASVHFFPRSPYQSIADVLSTPQQPCPFVAYSAGEGLTTPAKYEAVAFVDPSGLQFGDIGECIGHNCTPALFQYDLLYPEYLWP